ncbi:MAG: hypothetical protein MUO23_11220, partial [Anaerolineales bacterium]|nr:hypothetical protein [Anaerolineales bacterium]
MCALLPFILLAGCSAPLIGPSKVSPAVPERNLTRTPPPTATLVPPRGPEPASYETRTDTQGAVTFEVTPVNLSGATGTLEFAVVMNTHSVDLEWDLAERAVLRTDSGREVKGLSWPVGSGHHYSGTLSFPGQAPDGIVLLDGAGILTLIIRDTDVPERAFTWEV